MWWYHIVAHSWVRVWQKCGRLISSCFKLLSSHHKFVRTCWGMKQKCERSNQDSRILSDTTTKLFTVLWEQVWQKCEHNKTLCRLVRAWNKNVGGQIKVLECCVIPPHSCLQFCDSVTQKCGRLISSCSKLLSTHHKFVRTCWGIKQKCGRLNQGSRMLCETTTKLPTVLWEQLWQKCGALVSNCSKLKSNQHKFVQTC